MISHIMLNLRMYSQRRSAMAPGNLAKLMRASEVPSIMGTHSAGMTTMMASPVTPSIPRSHYSQQPRSMFTETLERFGAPMMGNENELDDYQEVAVLPTYSREDPDHSSRNFNLDWRRDSSIPLIPLNQARTREIDFP